MITPLTPRQQTLIVKNLVDACKDINKLNSTGYKFINTACGFIAHYNLNGFKGHYADGSLQDDIEHCARMNMWGNFTENDENYAYYMTRKEVYQKVLGYFAAQQFMREHIQHIVIA